MNTVFIKMTCGFLLFVCLLTMSSEMLLADTRKKDIATVLKDSGLTRQLMSIADIIYSNAIVDRLKDDSCIEITRNLVKDAIQPHLIVENIQRHLETILTTDELYSLLEWYGSDVGKRIRQKENNVSSEWRVANVAPEMQSLIEAIAATHNATQVSIQLQAIIEYSVYQLKLGGNVRRITFDQFISADRIVKMKKDTYPYILSSYIQTYNQLEPIDVASYLKFLRKPVTQSFYRETVHILYDSLKNQIDKMTAELLPGCQ